MSYWEKALNESMGRLGPVSTNNNTSDQPSPTFTLFPKLPTELRLKIWKHARQPRIIRFKYKSNNSSWSHLRAIAKPPVLFQVNREAREAALKIYELTFKSILNKQPIYIDYKVDALYMENWNIFESFYERAHFGSSDYEQEIRDLESKLRCLVLGDINCHDELDPEMMLANRNIENFILHFRNPTAPNEEAGIMGSTYAAGADDADPLRHARHAKEFARDVLREWKKNFSEDAEIPEVLFAKDDSGNIKVQFWEVCTLSKSTYLADH
jgi:hypothetical protein